MVLISHLITLLSLNEFMFYPQNELVCAGVLSGNRNFEGRIHPHIRANYLASPLLVIAYALAGTLDIDFKVRTLVKGLTLMFVP